MFCYNKESHVLDVKCNDNKLSASTQSIKYSCQFEPSLFKEEIMTVAVPSNTSKSAYVLPLEQLRMTDVPIVGGKNASLGEMISQLESEGVRVPGGFATTAQAFRDFLGYSADGGPTLAQRIADCLSALDVNDVRALAEAGAMIRQWIVDTPFQPSLQNEITTHYQ